MLTPDNEKKPVFKQVKEEAKKFEKDDGWDSFPVDTIKPLSKVVP